MLILSEHPIGLGIDLEIVGFTAHPSSPQAKYRRYTKVIIQGYASVTVILYDNAPTEVFLHWRDVKDHHSYMPIPNASVEAIRCAVFELSDNSIDILG